MKIYSKVNISSLQYIMLAFSPGGPGDEATVMISNWANTIIPMDLYNNNYNAAILHMDDYMNISRPGLHMTCGRSELILYTNQDKKESICHIASLEVVRGLEKSFEIDHSGFSLDANGTLRVSYLVNVTIQLIIIVWLP